MSRRVGRAGDRCARSQYPAGPYSVSRAPLTAQIVEVGRYFLPESRAIRSVLLIIVCLSTIYLLPSLYSPRKPILAPSRYPGLVAWPTYSIVLYLVALAVLGIRVRALDSAKGDHAPPLRFPGDDSHVRRGLEHEAMGASVWGGIAILTFSFSAQQSSFNQQASLRQTASVRGQSGTDEDAPVKAAKRYGWEAAAFLGMLGAALVSMAWGLTGYLSVPGGGRQGPSAFSRLI